MDGGWLIYSRGQCLPKCCYYFNGLKMAQLLSTAFMYAQHLLPRAIILFTSWH